MYTLNKLAEDGHCFGTRDMLMKTGAELLEVKEEILSTTLEAMIKADDVKIEAMAADDDKPAEPAIYLPPFYFSEVGTARRLRKIFSSPSSVKKGSTNRSTVVSNKTDYNNRSTVVYKTGNTDGPSMNNRPIVANKRISSNNVPGQKTTHLLKVDYDADQLNAINTAKTSKILILTGGPGTGKTTTTLGIINAFREVSATILLAAPTGRAAKRLSEATGMEAKTIHRLLEYKPPEGYQRNEDNPL